MNLPKPKFEEFGDGIKVTIYRGVYGTTYGINDYYDKKDGDNSVEFGDSSVNGSVILLLAKHKARL